MTGWMDGRMDGTTDRQIEEWSDTWMDGRTNGWKDRHR